MAGATVPLRSASASPTTYPGEVSTDRPEDCADEAVFEAPTAPSALPLWTAASAALGSEITLSTTFEKWTAEGFQ